MQSFAFASRLFDKGTRERAWLLYAWCRRCDDLADGQDHGGRQASPADGANRVKAMRVLTRREFAGMISIAVESADGAPTTVDLGSPAAQAIWMVAR